MYCELDLMTSLKDTKLLARVAWLAADCFVQLIVIATLTMEQELSRSLLRIHNYTKLYTTASSLPTSPAHCCCGCTFIQTS